MHAFSTEKEAENFILGRFFNKSNDSLVRSRMISTQWQSQLRTGTINLVLGIFSYPGINFKNNKYLPKGQILQV